MSEEIESVTLEFVATLNHMRGAKGKEPASFLYTVGFIQGSLAMIPEDDRIDWMKEKIKYIEDGGNSAVFAWLWGDDIQKH